MLAEETGRSVSSVTDNLRLDEDLGIGSMDATQICMRTEEALGITVPDSYLDTFSRAINTTAHDKRIQYPTVR